MAPILSHYPFHNPVLFYRDEVPYLIEDTPITPFKFWQLQSNQRQRWQLPQACAQGVLGVPGHTLITPCALSRGSTRWVVGGASVNALIILKTRFNFRNTLHPFLGCNVIWSQSTISHHQNLLPVTAGGTHVCLNFGVHTLMQQAVHTYGNVNPLCGTSVNYKCKVHLKLH